MTEGAEGPMPACLSDRHGDATLPADSPMRGAGEFAAAG